MNESVNRPNLRQLKIQAKELLQAVERGESSAVERVIPYFQKSGEVKLADVQLVIARENGFESWPKLRRELEGTVTPPEKSLTARFFEAIEGHDEELALSLLAGNPELAGAWRKTEYGWAGPLHIVAQHGGLRLLDALIEAGAEVYAVNQHDYPPVFYALYSQKEVADRLIEVSSRTDSGQPPTYGCGIDIVLASRFGMLDVIRKHVELDPLAVYRRGCIGETVLHWPSHNGYVEVVEYLLDQGALIEADEIGLYGGKPLHWASEHEAKSVDLLLRRGANPNSRNLHSGDFEGFTPLHMMASQPEQCIECAKLLLNAGADPSLLDAKGRTPLDVAREGGKSETVRFLEAIPSP